MITDDIEDEGIDLATFDKEKEIARITAALKAPAWNILVRLYTGPKKVGSLIMPPKTHENAIYDSCTGLVVDIGKGAYTHERYEHTGPWCEVGDWIVFPRHAGFRIFYGNTPLWYLTEDSIGPKCINDRPDLVSKYTY